MAGRIFTDGSSLGKTDPWTPWNLPRSSVGTVASGCLAAWWSTADHGTSLMTDDGAGLISNWIDRINGMAVTATTTARPTWAATSFNSAYPGMTFDGSANCLVNTTTFATFCPTAAIAGEIWAVGTAVTSATTYHLVQYGGTAVATLRRFGKGNSNLPFASDGTDTNNGLSGSIFLSPCVAKCDFSGTTLNLYGNGTASSTNPKTLTNTLNTGTTRLRIGASNATTAATFFNGVVSDIIILNGVSTSLTLSGRTTTVKQDLEGWAAWNYGMQTSSNSFLPVTHPWRYQKP